MYPARAQCAPYDRDFYDDPSYTRPQSEDCLYLHIWAPKDARGAPVAMWIHGGAFLGGWGTEKEFDGVEYARRGVILVSIEYRCNIFGFLAHPWLRDEHGRSGNYGILDQLAALNWIRENISAFGGDPDNITVFGQSAGAMSVQTLVSSPLSAGRIHRAIMQSGGSYGVGIHRFVTQEQQEEYGRVFSRILGAKDAEDMRARPARELSEALGRLMSEVMPLSHGMFLVPTVDGYVLEADHYTLIDQGRLLDIPYMLGNTADDIALPPDIADKRQSVLYRGCAAFSQKLCELGRAPAHVYWFKRPLPGDDSGAYHSSEILYMMGTLDRCRRPWTQSDRRLSQRMIDYWTAFMRTGNPNASGLPPWSPCTPEDPFVMEFDI